MAQKIKLQDIADHVGVSVITVSRALRGVGRVNISTQNKILEAAKSMGYRRHSGQLGTGFGPAFPADHCLRILLPLFRPCSDPFGGVLGAQAIQRIKEGVDHMGGELTVIEVDDLEDMRRKLPRARVHGIVLRQVLPVHWLKEIQTIAPVVYAISHDVQPHIDAIYFNEFKSSTLIFDALLSRGHNNIAWVCWDQANPLARVRQECFDLESGYDRQAFKFTRSRNGAQWVLDLGLRDRKVKHQHITLNTPLLASDTDIDYERAGLEAAEAILSLKDRPTAIVIEYDQIAPYTQIHLNQAGIIIPKQMSMVTYVLPETTEIGSSAISGVRLSFAQLGRMVPEIIQRRVANPNAPYISVMIEAEMVDRGSIAKAPAS